MAVVWNIGVPANQPFPIVNLYPIPVLAPLAPPQGAPQGRVMRLAESVRKKVENLLSAMDELRKDPNATSDLLRLCISGSKLLENTFHLPILKLLARSFTYITDFVSACSWVSRSKSIISGKAANEEPLFGGRDFLRVACKICYLVNDMCTITKWLESLGILQEIVTVEIGALKIFGRVVSVTLGRIGTVASSIGTIPNLIDNVRLVVKYSGARPETLPRARVVKLAGFAFDSMSDICRIASIVLFLIPNPLCTFLGLVVSTIGTGVSLMKFYYESSKKNALDTEMTNYTRLKGGAEGMARLYLQQGVGAEPHHAPVAVVPGAYQAILEASKALDLERRQLLNVTDPRIWAREILTRAPHSLLIMRANQQIPDDQMPAAEEQLHAAIVQGQLPIPA